MNMSPSLLTLNAPIAAVACDAVPLLPKDASWLLVLQAAIPAAIAFGVAIVAWRQLVTARAKLNLDLFEKRMPIYSKTRETLVALSNCTGCAPWELLNEFEELIPRASLLFGSDMRDYMREIHKRAYQYDARVRSSQVGPLYNTPEFMQEISDHRSWFAEQAGHVHEKFAPFLSFEKWK